jgi:hypothetical protein
MHDLGIIDLLFKGISKYLPMHLFDYFLATKVFSLISDVDPHSWFVDLDPHSLSPPLS